MYMGIQMFADLLWKVTHLQRNLPLTQKKPLCYAYSRNIMESVFQNNQSSSGDIT